MTRFDNVFYFGIKKNYLCKFILKTFDSFIDYFYIYFHFSHLNN